MNRVLLDACVLFPSITREMLLGAARKGFFTPLWSRRILDEWRFAAQKRDARTGAMAQTEILLLQAEWKQALVAVEPADYDDLILPDVNDRHVLAAAIKGRAAELVTANLKDFPTRLLAPYGIICRHPDGFLLEMAQQHRAEMVALSGKVLAAASEMQGRSLDLRKTLRKAGLPRLGKYLAA